VTAVTDALHNNRWNDHWIDARTQCNLPEPAKGIPLMPTIRCDGTFGNVPLSTSLASKWIRDLLILDGHDKFAVSRVSSHSLKATCLSWCSKAGVSREHRQVLGYHVVPGTQSVLHYSRDEQAEPLRQLSAVLLNIRLGKFDPDSSRSGYWKIVHDGYVGPTAKHKNQRPDKSDNPCHDDHGLSSSSSSSSGATRSEDLSDEEHAVNLNKDLDNPAKKKRTAAGVDHSYGFALHSRWRTLHVCRADNTDKLACGRQVTVLYRKLKGVPEVEHFKCQVCFGD
jgi:hypothetical protein